MKLKLYEVKFKANNSKRKHAEPYEKHLKLVKEFQDIDSANAYIRDYLLSSCGEFDYHVGLPGKGIINYQIGRRFYTLKPVEECEDEKD